MPEVPEGYKYVNLPANPFDNSCMVYVCTDCGSLVPQVAEFIVAHNEWHTEEEERLEKFMIRRARKENARLFEKEAYDTPISGAFIPPTSLNQYELDVLAEVDRIRMPGFPVTPELQQKARERVNERLDEEDKKRYGITE